MSIDAFGNDEKAAVAPFGRLRIAVAVGPAASATWTTRDPETGKPTGVAVDLGLDIAGRLGIAADLVEYSSSGAIVAAAAKGEWDIAFVPADAERKSQVLFGPNYFLGESTYLVSVASGIGSIEQVDRPGTRVLGIDYTATLRSAVRSLTKATATGVEKLDEAVRRFRTGEVDALALGRESLESLLPQLPGGRILDGNFHTAGSAVAMPLGREGGVRIVGRLLEQAKADGTVRALFDRHGMAGLAVAPLGSHP